MPERTIKGIRADLGLSQKQMAEALNLGESTYQKYENYERKIPATVLLDIADLAHIENPRTIKISK